MSQIVLVKMKKTLVINKDKETILRITISGREATVAEVFREIHELIFSYGKIGKTIKEDLRSKIEAEQLDDRKGGGE